MEITNVKIVKRPKYIEVGKTPMWVWVKYKLNEEEFELNFADEGQTAEQIMDVIKKDAARFSKAMEAKLTV